MSLRSEIRDAVDEIATPAPWLEDKVETFVLRDHRPRVGPGSLGIWGWTASRRQTLGLVAVGLVVALVAGLLIGGRLERERANRESSAASAISQAELRSLESRPLSLPELQPGAACPYTQDTQQVGVGQPVTGDGPVYVVNLLYFERTDQGDWNTALFYYVAQRPGPVLVRARDLHTNQRFVFAQYFAPSGGIATGPVLGTDFLNPDKVQLHPEAVLRDPWHLRPANQELIVMFAIPRATLCWGFQFDGPGFSETYVNGWDSPQVKGG